MPFYGWLKCAIDSSEQQQKIYILELFYKFTIFCFAVGRESETHPACGNRVILNLCLNIFAALFLAARPFSRSCCGTPPETFDRNKC
jgi:hypothetical protein